MVPISTPTKLADFTAEYCMRHTVNVEAGYVNNPNDLGSETNCGVTYATAQEHKPMLVSRFGWSGNMRDLTPEMALAVFDAGWWKRLALDQILAIHPFIADRMFDFGINAGRSRAAVALQRCLNVMNRQGKDYTDIKVDGAISPDGATVTALRALYAKRGTDGMLNLLELMADLQGAHYVEISEKREKNEDFTNGWATRIREARMLYSRILIQAV